jgi:ubiquinone/menaquinone biosynthesis C-methylase UbiE
MVAIMDKYVQSCKTQFWQKVLQVELEYLVRHLEGSSKVLSVGCGPAIIEGGLAKHGFRVTGLDVSQEALNYAPDQVRTVAARAEDMPFPESSFDAVIYVVSLQFIEDYHKAIERTAHVLRLNGKLIVMLLNPESAFFKERVRNPASYVSKIKHKSLGEIQTEIARHFYVRTEYFLGVRGGEIFVTREPAEACLFVVVGVLKPRGEHKEA